MLHNSGPSGPNETPVNMGAPLNISQLSTPMNMVQNLNNLNKLPQQPAPTASGHFNLPTYPAYGHPTGSVNSQMHPFTNYHSLGFQPSYIPQNSTVMQSSNWQSPILPMSLNMHSDHTQNMLNYSHLEKRLTQPVTSCIDQNYSTKTPLNIPQVPNKLFQKHSEPASSSPNTFSDNYKPYNSITDTNNLDLSMKSPESLLCNNTRRKNLENTVRLIENILINTTKNRDMQNSVTVKSTDKLCKEQIDAEERLSPIDYGNTDSGDEEENDIPDETEDNDCINDPLEDSKSHTKDDANDEVIDEEVSCRRKVVPLEKLLKETEAEFEAESSEKVIENNEIEIVIKEEPIEMEKQVVVKIEAFNSWTDTDSMTPFHRDTNGVMREDIVHGNIIDSETSVDEALAGIKNGVKLECYFECPHCCILMEHPKRFLIHVKWHSFGLINNQRIEIAREKEERKEAQRLERLESRPTSKLWPCKHCDKVYHAKGSLDSHRQRCHSNRVRQCKICDKSISGWTAWKVHLATHNTDTGYQCNECPKRFKFSHSLAKHKDTHLEKTHGCSECPKKFGSQALLKVHMKSHERAQKGATFHCTFCGKSFYDKFNLQIHERTHTNERPFVCEICNATFGCNSNLSRHLKVSHSASKPHVCSVCNRSFATELIRDRHEMRVHGDPEEFKYVCKQCPSRYLKMVDLRKHTYKMHPKTKIEKETK